MTLRRAMQFKALFSGRGARRSRRSSSHSIEVLEGRQLLATFTVTNLNPSGVGSLQRAIVQSNELVGADTINFDVAGTIRIGRASLPSITDTVKIDGSSAPSFAGSPVVTLDFHGSKGLNFAKGADGSVLRSLSLVRAGNAGVTLGASRVTVEGNYIGLLADGKTVAGNRGDGVRIEASSHGNLIGHDDPVTTINYYNADAVSIQPVLAWQGIRGSDTSGQYLITGTSTTDGLLYDGPISGVGGTTYAVNYPGATSTSVYGPDSLNGGGVRLVGSYKNGEGVVHGFLFEGTTAELQQSGGYRTIDYAGAKYTYVHSTMGGLAVGNADGPEGNAPLGTGHAFLYDVVQNAFLPDIVYPGSTTTTAYGIWHNGRASYTIAGGYTDLHDPSGAISRAYLVDYDSATGQYSNWTSFEYPNRLLGQDYITHFEGISSVEKGVYTLNADSVQTGTVGGPVQGSFVTVRREPDGTFGKSLWVDLDYPGVGGVASSNSVAGNQVVGLVLGDSGKFSFQATINTGFQLSNVISGNRGNGIGVYGANDNRIAMNFIGTDASGTIRRGNAKNGVLVTNGAARNMIGGQSTGGNDPTANVFVRPPQGNLISGNSSNGVLINNGATQTILSGNFVGTSASGNSSLGNRLDGVAIENANGNQLIGCTFQQSPFVFYNVLSGNGRNGLRITNSNDTTVHANFMGTGADNATIVANGGDGMLVSGSSSNTQVGGVIPLGNVISGNNRNGIEVRDTAKGFTSFNTFAGIYAFGGVAANGMNGILVTSSGGDNLIRTCIVSGNRGNGIEIGGNATGVQVVDTAIGTNTNIQTAIPNQGDGIRISGKAHGNAIGGFKPSVEPQVTISANRGYGINIIGSARDNVVFNTYLGTNAGGFAALGNELGGIRLGSGTSFNRIGGEAASFRNKILNNGGPGVTIRSSRGNALINNEIRNNAGGGVVVGGVVTGTSVQANDINGNTGDGLTLDSAQGLLVGGEASGTGNRILSNLGYGLYARGQNCGTVVRGNLIEANAAGNVDLTNSRGVHYMP